MARRDGRRDRRSLIGGLNRLEARRLLSIVPAWVDQSTADYVGPEAGVGPDGIYDDELTVGNIGLATTTRSVKGTEIFCTAGDLPRLRESVTRERPYGGDD